MQKIRPVVVIFLLSILFFSCKKTVDQAKEQYVLSVMTSGQWYLESYIENGVDNTADFQAYKFKFYEDSRISSITASETQTGTWLGDAATLTMTIQFVSADTQLQRISHPWLFTKSNIGLVFAETTTSSGKITIRLRKIP